MELFKIIMNCLVFLSCALSVNLQSIGKERTIQNPGYVELAPCPCDITENLCDFRCCCDNECTDQDKVRFTSCIPGLAGGQGGGKEDYKCGTKVFNPPDWHVLTCVYWENNAYLGMFFMNKNRIANQDSFTSDASDYMKNEFSLSEQESRFTDKDFAAAKYVKGIVLTTIQQTTTATQPGTLSLPQHLNSGQCNNLAPVRFLEAVQSSCRSSLTTTTCSALSVFSANIYAVSSAITTVPRPFQVTKELKGTDLANAEVRYWCATDIDDYQPSSTTPLGDSASTSTSNFPNTLQSVNCDEPCSDATCWQYNRGRGSSSIYETPLPTNQCGFDNGQTLPPSPSLTGANTCQNVVLEVRYTFEWEGQGIEKLTADVILGDVVSVSANPTVLAQRFSVKWIHKTNATTSSVDDNYFNSTQPYQRSGIAGYDPRKPLLSGCAQRNSNVFTRVDTEEEKQMAVFKSDVDGLCENANRESLTFGVDTMSSCAVRLTLDNLVACDALRQLIGNHLNVLMPSDVIGRYGYNDPDNEAMWVSVTRQNLTEIYQALRTPSPFVINSTGFQLSDEISGICFLPTSINLNVFYAKTGAINFHPRFEVIGAYINYTMTNWTMECMGANSQRCNATSGMAQNFFLYSTVRFIEVPPTTPSPKSRFYTRIDPETCDSDTCERFYSFWATDLCYYDSCWQEIAYPLTSEYDGDSHEYALAVFLVAVLGVVGYVSVAKPGWN